MTEPLNIYPPGTLVRIELPGADPRGGVIDAARVDGVDVASVRYLVGYWAGNSFETKWIPATAIKPTDRGATRAIGFNAADPG
jgi:hypothetical protein